MRLSDERYEAIKEVVTSMFEEYDIRCVPISPNEIAGRMEIPIIAYSSYPSSKQELLMKKSSDGFSAMDNEGRWKIYYNDALPFERVHNTLMHELGHIVLDHSEDSDLAEAEVKFFAKFALAPPVLVHKFQCEDYQDIARIFEISFEASVYAWEYYQKWLKHASKKYLNCDLRIWNQFNKYEKIC